MVFSLISSPRNKEIIFLIALFLAALSLRFAYLDSYMDMEIYPVMQLSDSFFYCSWAHDIASGRPQPQKAFMKWPLYAYVLASLFILRQESLTSVFILQFLLGSVFCVLVYLIAKKLFCKRVACLAGLFTLFFGRFIFYEGLAVYTSLALFLNALLFLYLLEIQHKLSYRQLFIGGVFAGLCTITQASSGVFAFIGILWLLRNFVSKPILFLQKFSVFIFGLTLVVGAVTLRNYRSEKDFVFIAGNAGINFYIGNNPQSLGIFKVPPDISSNQEGMFRDSRVIASYALGRQLKTSQVSQFWFRQGLKFIFQNPMTAAKLSLKKIVYFLGPREFAHDLEYSLISGRAFILKYLWKDLSFLFPAAVLGIIFGLSKIRESGLLYAGLIAFTLSVVPFFVSSRYRISIVPIMIIFSAFGLVSLWDLLRKRRTLNFILGLFLLVLIFVLQPYIYVFFKNVQSASQSHFVRALDFGIRNQFDNALVELDIGEWLEPDGTRIIFEKARVLAILGDYSNAERYLKSIIEKNSISAVAYYNLGYLYNMQSRFQEAKEVLTKAVSLYSEYAEAHYQLGVAYKSLGQPKEARVEFYRALKNINRWRSLEGQIIEKHLNELAR